MNEMPTAVVLAGGLGTRLHAVAGDRPKVLVPVGRRPFLSYLLDQVSAAGIHDVVLCTGYMDQRIQQAIGSTYGQLSVCYSHEAEPLGTAGALRLALERVDDDTWLVMNGDSYVDADLNAFLAWHRERKFTASLVLTRVENAARYGTVQVGKDGAISGFDEKRGATPAWINAGVYLISRRLIESLPSGKTLSIERDVFPRWIGNGLGGFRTRSAFLDVGTPESYAQAETFFANLGAQA